MNGCRLELAGRARRRASNFGTSHYMPAGIHRIVRAGTSALTLSGSQRFGGGEKRGSEQYDVLHDEAAPWTRGLEYTWCREQEGQRHDKHAGGCQAPVARRAWKPFAGRNDHARSYFENSDKRRRATQIKEGVQPAQEGAVFDKGLDRFRLEHSELGGARRHEQEGQPVPQDSDTSGTKELNARVGDHDFSCLATASNGLLLAPRIRTA